MKSIYHKITLVLVVGFFIQIVLVGIFYRQIVVKKIINEINSQEEKRQTVLQQATQTTQLLHNNSERLKKSLDQLSSKYKTFFLVKDSDGNVLYSTAGMEAAMKNRIESMGYAKTANKGNLLVYGYFPSMIKVRDLRETDRGRLLTVLLLFCVSGATFYVIYRSLTTPLRKLSRAVKNMDYGNTTLSIPYYGEDEIGLLCRNFEEMGARLKKSEENQQELLQAISHDVKTPLTSVIGYSKRLLEGKVKEEKNKEYYETIYRKANDIKSLLEELEDYSINNKEAKLFKEEVNFKEYFERFLEELRLEAKERNCSLNYNINVNDSCRISLDIKKIKRVFDNVINNSIKYAGDNCIIEINCIEKEDKVIFSIKDHGGGVPEDQLDKIFNRFFRVDSSRSRAKGGTGLGLAICKEIIEKHNGTIGASSAPDQGLTIWFILPKN